MISGSLSPKPRHQHRSAGSSLHHSDMFLHTPLPMLSCHLAVYCACQLLEPLLQQREGGVCDLAYASAHLKELMKPADVPCMIATLVSTTSMPRDCPAIWQWGTCVREKAHQCILCKHEHDILVSVSRGRSTQCTGQVLNVKQGNACDVQGCLHGCPNCPVQQTHGRAHSCPNDRSNHNRRQ